MRRLTGSITVFLSLVFLLVFALFGTLLETARYTVCKNHAARTLRTGAEGLLSEYNRPLYEHYGLFFIEKGGTPYEQVIGRYAGDTISAADKGEMDFLDGGIDDIQVKNKVYLGDIITQRHCKSRFALTWDVLSRRNSYKRCYIHQTI